MERAGGGTQCPVLDGATENLLLEAGKGANTTVFLLQLRALSLFTLHLCSIHAVLFEDCKKEATRRRAGAEHGTGKGAVRARNAESE